MATEPRPDASPDASPALPVFSLITPSYNQGQFLEKTIRSVLLQGYPRLQYIVIDGGSTDGSVTLLRKYSPWLSYWVSEKDRGQSHAINKGFAKATGEILGWLNSDDYLAPGTLTAVARELRQGMGRYVLAGDCIRTHADGSPPFLLRGKFSGRHALLRYWKVKLHQPAVFWRHEVLRKVGCLDESLHLTMDYDYWVRIARHYDIAKLDRVLAYTHFHGAAKTGDDYRGYYEELAKVAPRYWPAPWRLSRLRLEAARFLHQRVRPLLRRAPAATNRKRRQ